MNGFNRAEEFGYVVAAFLVVIGIVVLNDYLIRRSVQRSEKHNRPHRFQGSVNDTSWRQVLWLVIFVPSIFGLTMFVPQFKEWIGIARPVIPFLFPFVFLGVLLCFGWAYWRSRHSRHALRLAQQGDVSGAIEILREQLRLNGPSAELLNNLAAIYCQQLNWNRAWETICEAESCDQNSALVKINKAVILNKLERQEEAVQSLQQAQALAPRDVSVACKCGMMLAEIGRIEEAWKMLEKAEQAFKSQNSPGTFTRNPGPLAKRLEQEFLEPLRQRLTETPLSPTKPGLPEQTLESS